MAKITGDMNVGQVLDQYPETLPVFIRYFKPLANPVMRKAMGRLVTIEQAAKIHRLDQQKLLADLNAVVDGKA